MVKKTVHAYIVLARISQTPQQIKEEGGRERENVENTSQVYIFFSFTISLIRPTTQITNYFTSNSNSQLFQIQIILFSLAFLEYYF